MKCFFLRATCYNETKIGVVEYDEEIVNEMIYEYLNKIKKKGISFTVTHDKAHITPHVHALLCIDDENLRMYDLYNDFKYIEVEEVRNIEGTYRYLTHSGFNHKKDFYPNKAVCGMMYMKVGDNILPYRIPYNKKKSKEFEREMLRGDE